MSNKLCPHCGATFPSSVVNVVDGATLCPKCGKTVPPIKINITRESIEKLLSKNLNGCTIVDNGNCVTVEASTRSAGDFIAMLAICLFCNGIILTLIVGFSLETYFQFFGHRPTWFREMQWEGGPQNAMPLGLVWIFFVPFVALGCLIVWFMILYLRGKNTIELYDSKAILSTGFGRFQLREEFRPEVVSKIYLEEISNESTGQHIEIHADHVVNFGSALTLARLEWLESVLNFIFLPDDETEGANFLERARQLAAMINGPRVPSAKWSEFM